MPFQSNDETDTYEFDEADDDRCIANTIAALQLQHSKKSQLYPSTSVMDDDESVLEEDIAQFASNFQQSRRNNRRRSVTSRDAIVSRGETLDPPPVKSRKRRSLNSCGQNIDASDFDCDCGDDDWEFRGEQSTVETEEDSGFSVRRPRKRLSHSSAMSSQSSIGPLDPVKAHSRIRRRAAIRVDPFELEARADLASRQKLLMKDRYETKRVARRSMSHTAGLGMHREGSIISSSMPEEGELTVDRDIKRLSRSRFNRRVLSLPDPNAIRRLSETSINEDVDFNHGGQSALSASLLASQRKLYMTPSFHDHMVGRNVESVPQEYSTIRQFSANDRLYGTYANVPPSISYRNQEHSSPMGVGFHQNIPTSKPTQFQCSGADQVMAQRGREFMPLSASNTQRFTGPMDSISQSPSTSFMDIQLHNTSYQANHYSQQAQAVSSHHDRAARVANQPEPGVFPNIYDQCQDIHLNGRENNFNDTFDGKKTKAHAIQPMPHQEYAIMMMKKAVETDDTDIKHIYNLVQNCKESSRLILNKSLEDCKDDVAIHLAARKGNLYALKALLDVDKESSMIRNNVGHVPLHIAVESGNFAAVAYLCATSPTSAKVQCEEGCLPLHDVVSTTAHHQDALQITATLLSTFPEAVLVTTDEGLLPIHLAAMSGFASGLRTLFAYNFETIFSKEPTEMMLPLDFAVDGLQPKEGDTLDTEFLSLAHQQPVSSQEETDLKSNFELCTEILLISTLYKRPVLKPRCRENNKFLFLPLHGAVVAQSQQKRTWNRLLALYGKQHIKDIDDHGRNIAHILCSKLTEDAERTDHNLSMLKEIHQIEPSLFFRADNSDFLPLHHCLMSKPPPSYDIVKVVVEFNHSALTTEINRVTAYKEFLPFQLAAVFGCDEDVIQFLLRNHPVGVQAPVNR